MTLIFWNQSWSWWPLSQTTCLPSTSTWSKWYRTVSYQIVGSTFRKSTLILWCNSWFDLTLKWVHRLLLNKSHVFRIYNVLHKLTNCTKIEHSPVDCSAVSQMAKWSNQLNCSALILKSLSLILICNANTRPTLLTKTSANREWRREMIKKRRRRWWWKKRTKKIMQRNRSYRNKLNKCHPTAYSLMHFKEYKSCWNLLWSNLKMKLVLVKMNRRRSRWMRRKLGSKKFN